MYLLTFAQFLLNFLFAQPSEEQPCFSTDPLTVHAHCSDTQLKLISNDSNLNFNVTLLFDESKFNHEHRKFDIIFELGECPLLGQFEMEQDNKQEWTPPNERKFRPAVYFNQCCTNSNIHPGRYLPATFTLHDYNYYLNDPPLLISSNCQIKAQQHKKFEWTTLNVRLRSHSVTIQQPALRFVFSPNLKLFSSDSHNST